jgi:hypothetical protein
VSKSKLLVLLALLCATRINPLWSQSYQGGVRGKVSDATGGAIDIARVTLTGQATGVTRATLSNAGGEFVFNAVDPATYRITIEAAGFKRFERAGVIVSTQEFLTLDLKLEIGAVTESVNVTEEVPLLETSNASMGQVVDRQKLVDLPNLGRNPFMMAKIAPNIVQAGDPRFNRMQDQSGSSQISIAGGPVRGNSYLLDGVPITASSNVAIIIPTIESVQEVKIQSNTYDAEMGSTGGGVFNTFLKSGSNDFHGSLFGYMRETDWQANTFFNNRGGIARPNQPFKNFGGSIGGPVSIPKLYNGKNRTFFWIGAEGYRQISPLTKDSAVPNAAERVGDFSQSITKGGAQNTIYDPQSTRTDSTGAVIRTPFAGNIIPQARINPIGLALASYFPAPRRTAKYLGDLNYTGIGSLFDRANQQTGKLDQVVTSWWRANLSYLHYNSREPSGNLFQSVSAPGATLLYRQVNATQVNNVLTPNATTVISVRYGFNRYPNFTGTESDGFNPAKLGFPSSFVDQLQVLKFPSITMQTMTGMGGGSTSATVYDSRNFLADINKFKGRHSFKAGFAYRTIHTDSFTFGTAGSFTFNDGFTRKDPNKGNDGSGSDVASMLVGAPSAGSAIRATKLFDFAHYYAGFIHDDFRVSAKLTLNLGLRYEYVTGLAERDNRFIVGFDRTAASPFGPPAKGGVMYAGVNGNPTTCCSPSKKAFGPRAGFAWSLNDKTVIRGGYGLFWAPNNNGTLATLGYSQTTDYVSSNDGGNTPANSLSNPFPGGLLQPVGNTQGLATGVGQTITFIDQKTGSTKVHQFSLEVQRQLPANITASAGYVGSRTSDLIIGTGAINVDQLEGTYLSQGSALLQTIDNPFYGRGGAGVVAAAKVTRSQLLRPFPQFGAVNQTGGSLNSARYDSLVLRAQKRMSAGVTFLTSWTWSKNYDGSFGASNYFITSSTSPQDAYNLPAEYGLAIVNTPSSWKSAISYELPFGKGKRLLNHSAALNYLAGGWQVNVVNLIQTGFPLAITQDQNFNSVIGAGVQRPNATGTSPVTSGRIQDRLDGYLDPKAFTNAPQFTFGNVSRSIGYRGPGTANWDFSLMKTFSVKERFHGQFRAEALNLFNTPVFNGPNTSFGNANFGKITQQGNFSRLIQLGVRMTF